MLLSWFLSISSSQLLLIHSHWHQVASACFIQPPLCYVGVTEEEAVNQYKGDLDIYVSKFKPLKNTLTGRDERTLMKMIVHSDTDTVSNVPL